MHCPKQWSQWQSPNFTLKNSLQWPKLRITIGFGGEMISITLLANVTESPVLVAAWHRDAAICVTFMMLQFSCIHPIQHRNMVTLWGYNVITPPPRPGNSPPGCPTSLPVHLLTTHLYAWILRFRPLKFRFCLVKNQLNKINLLDIYIYHLRLHWCPIYYIVSIQNYMSFLVSHHLFSIVLMIMLCSN